MRILTIACFLLITFFYSTGFAQENCQLKKSGEGIKVYLCETAGSPFKTIKVYFKAKGDLKTYASGVFDVAGYRNWQASIDTSYILTKISNSELMYYSEIATPWPISARDLVFNLKIEQNETTKALHISLNQHPDYIKHIDGIVRIPKANSVLMVTPLSPNELDVSYILHVDPGGEIPAFVANMFAASTPWNTFKNFRQMLEAGEFKIDESLSIINY